MPARASAQGRSSVGRGLGASRVGQWEGCSESSGGDTEHERTGWAGEGRGLSRVPMSSGLGAGPHRRRGLVGDQGNTGPPGWALVPCDRGPCKKRGSGHRHARRDDPVRTQGEDGRPHTGEGPWGDPAPPTPGPRAPAARMGDGDRLRCEPRVWAFLLRPQDTDAGTCCSGKRSSCCNKQPRGLRPHSAQLWGAVLGRGLRSCPRTPGFSSLRASESPAGAPCPAAGEGPGDREEGWGARGPAGCTRATESSASGRHRSSSCTPGRERQQCPGSRQVLRQPPTSPGVRQ